MDHETGPSEGGERERESQNEKRLAELLSEGYPDENEPQADNPKQKSSFGTAFWTSLGINGLTALIFVCGLASTLPYPEMENLYVFGAVWLLVNVGIAIALFLNKPKDFQKWIAGIAVGFLISVAAGVFLGSICFSMY